MWKATALRSKCMSNFYFASPLQSARETSELNMCRNISQPMVLHKIQIVFGQDYSCTKAVHTLTDLRPYINRGKFCIPDVLRLRKTFDCVNHGFLLRNLYNITGRLLLLIDSFLSNC